MTAPTLKIKRLEERVRELEAALVLAYNALLPQPATKRITKGETARKVISRLLTLGPITCPNCGDDRTGKGSLIYNGKSFCSDACCNEWQAAERPEVE